MITYPASALLAMLVTTALTGCGSASLGSASSGSASSGHPASTPATTVSAAPTPLPTSTPTPSAVQVAVPHGRIPAALVGTYTYQMFGTWHATLRGDGTYAQWNPNGLLDITGRYGVHGDIAVFVDKLTSDSKGVACDGPGAYAWRFAGARLVMRVHHDECTVGRIQQWTAGWTKVRSAVLRIAPTLQAARGH
jgi:hypothetical protein